MLVTILLVVIFLLAIILFLFYRKASGLEQQLEELSFQKASQSVKYGKITEQFVPFLDDLPFSSENFRFLGSPIDGVAFEPDSIVFCEFKAADSKLSPLQQRIKGLVEAKKIEWVEFRLR